ncbi:MAG: class I SAM-dependent methyltransferase [Nocardioides sp.]|uniref:class I SAM-dependent methyltransferase n=1 Tax=Nocardioides sp. TaxID=35761 RepID=UPI0039E491F0
MTTTPATPATPATSATPTTREYLLGHREDELRRLEQQAQVLAPATTAFLTLAGIEPGMRVLDLGTGAGDVAFLVARRVGPTGSVVGIDAAAEALHLARWRANRAKVGNVSFVEGDLLTAELAGTFDAVVGRLILLYVDDPTAVVRRYAGLLRPGGVLLALEYDMSAVGNLPPLPLSTRAAHWLVEAFRRTGHDPCLGARVGGVLASAGADATCLGLQVYLAADDPAGPRLLSATLRSLLPAIESTGIATADEVGIDSLTDRLAADQLAAGALVKPPTLVGAWGRWPATPVRGPA